MLSYFVILSAQNIRTDPIPLKNLVSSNCHPNNLLYSGPGIILILSKVEEVNPEIFKCTRLPPYD